MGKGEENIENILRYEGDYIIVQIPLHLFRNNMEKIVDDVIPQIENNKKVVVDAKNCPYPSTEVIEILLRILKIYSAKEKTYRMPIVRPSLNWKKVFKIVNIDTLFNYYDDINEAQRYYESLSL